MPKPEERTAYTPEDSSDVQARIIKYIADSLVCVDYRGRLDRYEDEF